MSTKKLFFFLVVVSVIGLAIYFLRDYLTFSAIKGYQATIEEYYEENAALCIAAFFFGYIAVTALSLPGAAFLTLLAGAIFKLLIGLILVSFASSIGATLAFLVSRYFLGESLQKKYADKLAKVNEHLEKEGVFYLFAMRLIPAIPFFLINLLMGLTKIKPFTFYWVSQTGMLAGTIVYVNAGTQLASIDSPAGILSPVLIGSFLLLGFFPLIAKKAIAVIKKKNAGAASD